MTSDLATTETSRVLSRPTVSVVIPAMNEAANLAYVLERLPKELHEVILVDGHSTDDTIALARKGWPSVIVIEQAGYGKGDGLTCGFATATGDIIVTIDADGSMDPGEIPTLVATMLDEDSDFAKGSRRLSGGGSDDLTLIRRVGNCFLRALVNRMYETEYTDLCYGLTAFWRMHLPALGVAPRSGDDQTIGHLGSGFEIETCLNIRAARSGLKVIEVPSHEYARRHGTSNLHVVRDGVRVLRSILRERRRPTTRSSFFGVDEMSSIPVSAGL